MLPGQLAEIKCFLYFLFLKLQLTFIYFKLKNMFLVLVNYYNRFLPRVIIPLQSFYCTIKVNIFLFKLFK